MQLFAPDKTLKNDVKDGEKIYTGH